MTSKNSAYNYLTQHECKFISALGTGAYRSASLGRRITEFPTRRAALINYRDVLDLRQNWGSVDKETIYAWLLEELKNA